jgi:hypothetical protein
MPASPASRDGGSERIEGSDCNPVQIFRIRVLVVSEPDFRHRYPADHGTRLRR